MEENKSTTVKKTVKSGITFGSALAMVISYTTWKSVGWAIFHGLLSWVYVIYFLLRYYIGIDRGNEMFEELGISFGTALIVLLALYFIIKWAVKNGIKEAYRDITGKVTTEDIEAEQICNEEEK